MEFKLRSLGLSGTNDHSKNETFRFISITAADQNWHRRMLRTSERAFSVPKA
jgi:hypothetical protein